MHAWLPDCLGTLGCVSCAFQGLLWILQGCELVAFFAFIGLFAKGVVKLDLTWLFFFWSLSRYILLSK